jgi:hypothetical protein
MSAARMLSVSRRITFALDNFYARVHQKSGNGLEADVHLDARARAYIVIQIYSTCPMYLKA